VAQEQSYLQIHASHFPKNFADHTSYHNLLRRTTPEANARRDARFLRTEHPRSIHYHGGRSPVYTRTTSDPVVCNTFKERERERESRISIVSLAPSLDGILDSLESLAIVRKKERHTRPTLYLQKITTIRPNYANSITGIFFL
jgi:hypothetical protein